MQVMTDFALSLFAVLDNINKHSFNNFRLRIGTCQLIGIVML